MTSSKRLHSERNELLNISIWSLLSVEQDDLSCSISPVCVYCISLTIYFSCFTWSISRSASSDTDWNWFRSSAKSRYDFAISGQTSSLSTSKQMWTLLVEGTRLLASSSAITSSSCLIVALMSSYSNVVISPKMLLRNFLESLRNIFTRSCSNLASCPSACSCKTEIFWAYI